MAIQNIRIKFVTDDSDLAKSDKALDKLTASEKQLQQEFEKANKSAKNSFDTIGKGAKNSENNLNDLNKTVKTVGAGILAAFTLDRLTAFGAKVIEITSSFQKYEAVLTNVLGNQVLARTTLLNLTEQAVKSNFALSELTEGYLKLVNQGFKPTNAELENLQDVANSTGKSFDQLVEAIIDAQTGEFERLKEFGIRASKQGDQVKFTFKEVQTQVDFTASSIRKYVLGLGDLEGVTGSTAAISNTLGGQISNLGDSYDQFFATIGKGNSGVLSSTVSLLSKALQLATELSKSDEQRNEEMVGKLVQVEIEGANARINALIESGKTSAEAYKQVLKELQDEIDNTPFANSTQTGKNQVDELKATQQALLNQQKENAGKEIALKDELAKKEIERQKELDKTYKAELSRLAEREKNAIREAEINKKDKAELLDIESQYNITRVGLFKKYNQTNLEELRGYNLRFREINNERADFFESKRKEYNKSIDDDTRAAFEIEQEYQLNVDKVRQDEFDAEIERQLKLDENDKKLKKEQGEREKQLAEEKRQIAYAIVDGLTSIYNTYNENQRIENQQQQADNEINRKNELSYYEGDKVAQSKINAKYDDVQRKLKREQAIRDRDQTLFNIGIATAQAVVSALGSIPFTPANIALSAIVGGLGAIQLGLVASRPLPKYARGVEMLTGAGTETSDSIHAMLSKGERVVPADTNKDYYPTLTAIHNRHIPPELLNNMVMNYDRIGAKHDVIINDNSGQTSELKSINKKLDNLKQVNINIDKNGIHAFAETQFSKKEHVNNYLTL